MASEPKELIRTVDIKITKDYDEIIEAYEFIKSSVSSSDPCSAEWAPFFKRNKLTHPATFYAAHPNVGVAVLSFGEFSLARCLVYRADSKANWTDYSPPYGDAWLILANALYDAGLKYTKHNVWKTTEKFIIPGEKVLVGKNKQEDYALFFPFFDTLAMMKVTFDKVTKQFKFYPMSTGETITGPYAILRGQTHKGFLLASEIEASISASRQEKLKAS